MPQFQAHTPGSAAILGRTLCGLEARVPNERLTASQGGASLLVRSHLFFENFGSRGAPDGPGKREGRENRLRSRHCDRRARSSQPVSRRTATFLPAQKGKAEEEAMTREPGNLPGNYDSA
jgi:hypothetical protein